MTIPGYQKFMTPLLQLASDRKEHSLKETYDRLADHFDLTPEERTELLPSGEMPPNEQVAFAELILASIDHEEEEEVPQAWLSEVKNRMNAVKEGRAKLLDFKCLYYES